MKKSWVLILVLLAICFLMVFLTVLNSRPSTAVATPRSTPRTSTASQSSSSSTTLTFPTGIVKTLRGSGDDVVSVSLDGTPLLVHVVGNRNERHFAVKNYGGSDQYDLLVNTTESYDGVRPLDWRSGEKTTRFEITAEGSWTIEIMRLGEARYLTVPGSIQGNGDEVILIKGKKPDIANVSGNAGSHHFAVWQHGKYSDLLVNTTDPYDGRVIMDGDTLALEVVAEGSWRIQVQD